MSDVDLLGRRWEPENITDIRAADFTAELLAIHPVDLSGGAISVLPPLNPRPGHTFRLVDAYGDAALNNMTANFVGGSQFLNGSSQNYVLSTNNGSVQFLYVGETKAGVMIGWITDL